VYTGTDDTVSVVTEEDLMANATIGGGNVTNSSNTVHLPPEKEQPESWSYSVLGIFLGLAAILCAAGSIRNWRQRRDKRNQYEEISQQEFVV
jgi:hypothetical protein